MLFPSSFFVLLVYGAIAMSIVGSVLLIALLSYDWKRGALW